MNFVVVDDNYVINLDQVKYFYWAEKEQGLHLVIFLREDKFTFTPVESVRMLRTCLNKGIPVPKWVVEKYAD